MRTAINHSRKSRCISHSVRTISAATVALAAYGPLNVNANAQNDPMPGAVQEQPRAGSPRLRLRIAVDQFKWNEVREDSGLPHDLKEGLQAHLIEQLQKSGRFQVMEREATVRAQTSDEDEIARQKRETLPESSAAANAAVRQRRTPAQYIITATVTGLQETSSGNDGFVLGGIVKVGGKKQKTTLSINIRITDAETSETVDSFTASGNSESKGQDVNINLGGISAGKSESKQSDMSKVVGATLCDAVTKISARLAKEPWYGLVAKQDSNTGHVVLAAGSEAGIEPGMEFVVNQTGEPIRHPETGDIISRGDETEIGRIRIVRVERGVSYAAVVSGAGFKPGNMVRQPQ